MTRFERGRREGSSSAGRSSVADRPSPPPAPAPSAPIAPPPPPPTQASGSGLPQPPKPPTIDDVRALARHFWGGAGEGRRPDLEAVVEASKALTPAERRRLAYELPFAFGDTGRRADALRVVLAREE